jgi:DNA-nicking Smr family endonuclease
MPRRRLHGTTQQRRQKPRSRELKRRAAVARRRQTQVAQPFERSATLDPEDVQFLETMRDLRVHPLPRQPVAREREQAIARTHLAAEAENDLAFGKAMAGLGVQPLGSPADVASQATHPWPYPAPATAIVSESGESAVRPPRTSRSNKLETIVPEPRQRSPAPGPIRVKPGETSTIFHESDQDRQLMELALQQGLNNLQEKFQGAPANRRSSHSGSHGRHARSGAEDRARLADEREPDAELDLHGKTQEAAIRLVQNFLLTAHRQRLRSVLVITGRGLRSGDAGPILRDAVHSWLERNGGPYLRDFHPAPSRHGGDGAWWVWMK